MPARDLSVLSIADRRRFRRGDADLFRVLVDVHSPRLLAVARSVAADLDDAHDLVQETWVRAYEKRRSFSGKGTMIGWLLTMCRNLAFSDHRRTSRVVGGLGDSATDGAPSPGDHAEWAALRDAIHLAVLDLPPRERDVVVLRMLDGRSTRETAQVLACAEGTVKATLFHALRKLERPLEVWAP